MSEIPRPSIDPSHRLTNQCEVLECGIDEYRDGEGSVTIHFKGRPDQLEQWRELTEAGVTTPSLVEQPDVDTNPDDFELVLAGDSRLVSDQIHLLKKDVDNYSQIFFMIGQVIGKIDRNMENGLLADKKRGLLASFYMHYDPNSDDGVDLVLVPPYRIGDVSLGEMLEQVEQELQSSGHFTPEQIIILLEAVQTGVRYYDE